MNVFFTVTIKSSSEGYLYTFHIPLGVTGPGAHVLSSKALESLTASIDKIQVLEEDKVYLQFSIRNPQTSGIKLYVMSDNQNSVIITMRCDIGKHSGIPAYQLFGRTWVVTKLRVEAVPIIEAISL